jgi:hypothetical protein
MATRRRAATSGCAEQRESKGLAAMQTARDPIDVPSDTPSDPTVLSTHLLRRRADRRAARLRRLQGAAVGSFHVMPDRLCEEELQAQGVGLDDAIRVVRLPGRVQRYSVIAERGCAAQSTR